MKIEELNLEATLLQQSFLPDGNVSHDELWHKMQQVSRTFVAIEGGFAVLSDMMRNQSFICAGGFGRIVGIGNQEMTIDSIFEDDIFRYINADDLLRKHAQELRFFSFVKSLPVESRSDYSARCVLRFCDVDTGKIHFVQHRMFYCDHHQDGSIGIALCLYTPAYNELPAVGISAQIVNSTTGDVVSDKQYSGIDKKLLSRREVEILSLIAHGDGTKQIAERLSISPNTVQRHRQNIMQHLQVNNCTEAVHVAMYLGLI